METNLNIKWYQKSFGIILLLVLFFPVGLYLMWRYANWKKSAKWLITGVLALAVLVNGSEKKVSNSDIKNAQLTQTETKPSLTVEPSQLLDSKDEADNNLVLVTRVIDGDTIEIEGGQRVRYIGIDSPELNQDQCFSLQATNRNKELVENKKVRLEKDVSETDRYGRLLRYIYTEGGLFVNDILVKEGYAHSYSYPPDIKYQETFVKSQKEASSTSLGLWGGCNNVSTPKPTSSSTTTSQTSNTNTNCTIKGNISSSDEKIYHIVGCQSYNKTTVDTSKGERWFCTEVEAQQAGWRKALNCP